MTNLKRAFLFIGLFVILFSSASPTIAHALDVDFYSGNDILFYDPDACTVTSQSGNVAIVGNDVAEKVFHFLTSTSFSGIGGKPFNAIQAAGALGNFQQESSMNPASIEPNGAGHGLAQWTAGRYTALQAHAQQQSKDWTDLQVQLTMIENEINTSYGKTLLDRGFGDIATPKDASFIFQSVYEIAGTPNQANRDNAAQAYYDKFKNSAPANANTSSSSTSTGSTRSSCTGSASGDFTTNFTFYNQCNDPWGAMPTPSGKACNFACGPTSVAMLVKNMTGQNITPSDTFSYVSAHNLWMSGGGTSFDTTIQTAANWGLKGSMIQNNKDINEYKKVLDAGGLIIIAGSGPAPFVEKPLAHFVVIRSLTSDGKFIIADPYPKTINSKSDNEQPLDAQQILDSGFGSMAFYKN